jgi:hypothetical protein
MSEAVCDEAHFVYFVNVICNDVGCKIVIIFYL